jgi:hypothetical protein
MHAYPSTQTFDGEYAGRRTRDESGRALVGVGVMVVVLDAPGLERVDEGHEHESAHNVLHQLVLAEAAVPAVMAHHKELRQSRQTNMSASSNTPSMHER